MEGYLLQCYLQYSLLKDSLVCTIYTTTVWSVSKETQVVCLIAENIHTPAHGRFTGLAAPHLLGIFNELP